MKSILLGWLPKILIRYTILAYIMYILDIRYIRGKTSILEINLCLLLKFYLLGQLDIGGYLII